MAKRSTGVGVSRKTHSHKTKKRLEVKRQMLFLKSKNNNKHCRPINPERLKPSV